MSFFKNYGMLVVIVIVGGAITLGESDAWACSCGQRDEKAQYDAAEAVVFAEVTDTRLQRAGAGSFGDVIEANIVVLEYFKKPASEMTTVHGLTFSFGNCSIGLMSGMKYIFFVAPAKGGLGGLVNYVGMCTGSRAVNAGYKDFDKILAKLRSYGAPER